MSSLSRTNGSNLPGDSNGVIKRSRVRNKDAPWMRARNDAVTVRRPYPHFVDMGVLTANVEVRYDPEHKVYDLRDALRAQAEVPIGPAGDVIRPFEAEWMLDACALLRP